MIGIGCLEKLLEVINRLSCRALEIVHGSGDELLIGVTNIFVVVTLITAGSDRNSLGSLLQAPLIAFGASLCTLVGCLGRRRSTTARGHLPAVLNENGPDLLLS
jgi:hypothetical protein